MATAPWRTAECRLFFLQSLGVACGLYPSTMSARRRRRRRMPPSCCVEGSPRVPPVSLLLVVSQSVPMQPPNLWVQHWRRRHLRPQQARLPLVALQLV